ncbi:hypothetical protein LINPERHAP2_LOCUS23823 [Linum perenne]
MWRIQLTSSIVISPISPPPENHGHFRLQVAPSVSLGLDGSELSGQSIEEEQLNRRSNVQQKDIPLSELLDLKIRWPTDSEIGETRNEVLEKIAIEKLQTLDFEGLDLSSFSPEPKVEPTSESRP